MPNATCLLVPGGCRGRLIGYPERLARVARARRLEKVLGFAAAEMPRAGKRVVGTVRLPLTVGVAAGVSA